MNHDDVSIKVEFTNSKQKSLITLQALIDKSVEFLEYYSDEFLLGSEFMSLVGDGSGAEKFQRLLSAAGYAGDPFKFFIAIVQIVERQNSGNARPIEIGGVELPYLFMIGLMEVFIPGNRFVSVKSLSQLEKLTNLNVPADERDRIREILDLFPVRLSMHTIRQMRLSRHVAYQYMPFVDELHEGGAVHTWVGQFHRGIVEQMYQNRIIFILNMACPVYCRFCFRKHKETRNQRAPKQEHVKNAVQYVKLSPDIKEIVLTGGDPFMNRATLTYAVDGLRDIPHVQTLRIATRSIAYYPHLFYANNAFWMNYLKRKVLELKLKGKRMEIATHFIHPDEISIESLDIISDLTGSGIPVYVQTPLLKDCNDQGPELRTLYSRLRGAGAEIHYIYIPCSPIQGNEQYITPISTGIQLAARLRATLSDRAMPRICTATKIGKIDWNLSGWAVERDAENPRNIWIRTPYTQDYFNEFAPILQLQQFARVNAEGTLDVKFDAEIGDDSLLWGPRHHKTLDSLIPQEQELMDDGSGKLLDELARIKSHALADQRIPQSIVETGIPSIQRMHLTRVELDAGAAHDDLVTAIDYIRSRPEITDLILTAEQDAIRMPSRVKRLVMELAEIPHLTAVRLRSFAVNNHPELVTPGLLSLLGKLNNLSISSPLRLEIETMFFSSAEFRPEHRTLALRLMDRGITLYGNTPLLSHINDKPLEIAEIAYRYRESGIEFHHLYLAGLPIQSDWQQQFPVDISRILDIATEIRRNESGRGIPRFIIRTEMGEVDFGLTSVVHNTDEEGRLYLKLLPYTLHDFQTMDADYQLPDDITLDSDGHPVVRVPGICRTPEFLVD